MTVFDSFVLPQSLEHSTLLHFLSVVVLFVFIPYLGILTGGFLLSMKLRGSAYRDNRSARSLAARIMELTSVNKSTGIAIGVAPVLLLILVSVQIHHTMNSFAPLYFLFAFFFLALAIASIFTYRYALRYAEIMPGDDSRQSLHEQNLRLNHLAAKSGRIGLVTLLLGVFFLGGGFWGGLEQLAAESWTSVFFALPVYVRLAFFLSLSFLLAPAFLLFRSRFWEGGDNLLSESEKDLLDEQVHLILPAAFLLSLILFVWIAVLLVPNALSAEVFLTVFSGMALLFVAAHLFYNSLKKRDKKAASLFLLALAFTLSYVLTESSALVSATNKNALLLAVKYEEAKKEWQKSAGGAAALSGVEVFNLRCSSCHKFDVKLVGPPYKETLPKYAGDVTKLIAYIKNPVKINPAYPPMPNLGLKPAEVRAVANYLLEEVKKK